MAKNSESKIKVLYDNVKFPLLAIFLSFFVGSIFIIWTNNSPLEAYIALFSGSLIGMSRIGETLLKTTPLIFTGLSIAFAFRCGLFNIGAEGQYVIGALFAVGAGWIFRGLPGIVLVPTVLISGAIGGGLWAAIPGFLKAKFGIHEVIVTIMLNYVSLFVSNFMVRTVLNPSTLQGTEVKAYSVILPEHARLTTLSDIFPFFGSSSVHSGIFIAIAVAIITWFVLFKTTFGYEVRSVGNNPTGAEYGGISVAKNIIMAMVVSGMFAGLAGATMVQGLNFKIDQAAGTPQYGFTGIAVALVGKNHPIGVLASALLFGILSNGARKMQIAGIPQEVVGIIQGVIIIFIAGEAILRYLPDLLHVFKKKKEVAK